MKRRDPNEIMLDIRTKMPEFDKAELLEYTKWAIPKLYNSLKNEEKIRVKCKLELIDKLNKEKVKYRINKNIDHVSVQYIELFDNIETCNEMYIQLYLSVYFYDDVQNNSNIDSTNDKYWNDIWIVTCRESVKLDRRKSNCANCGAIMRYNRIKDIFKCEYCGNIVRNRVDSMWEIIDIELGH